MQKEFLVQHYIWYQLDLHSMRLYYIYLQQQELSSRVSSINMSVLCFFYSTSNFVGSRPSCASE